MGNSKTVMIAEDRQGMRKLIRLVVDHENDLEVVAEAADGEEALILANELHPTAVVLDLGLPIVDGEVVLDRLHHRFPETKIIVLSGQASALIQGRVLRHGAAAVVEKGGSDWESTLVAHLRSP